MIHTPRNVISPRARNCTPRSRVCVCVCVFYSVCALQTPHTRATNAKHALQTKPRHARRAHQQGYGGWAPFKAPPLAFTACTEPSRAMYLGQKTTNKHTVHSTQHTSHSTHNTAHSTQCAPASLTSASRTAVAAYTPLSSRPSYVPAVTSSTNLVRRATGEGE